MTLSEILELCSRLSNTITFVNFTWITIAVFVLIFILFGTWYDTISWDSWRDEFKDKDLSESRFRELKLIRRVCRVFLSSFVVLILLLTTAFGASLVNWRQKAVLNNHYFSAVEEDLRSEYDFSKVAPGPASKYEETPESTEIFGGKKYKYTSGEEALRGGYNWIKKGLDPYNLYQPVVTLTLEDGEAHDFLLKIVDGDAVLNPTVDDGVEAKKILDKIRMHRGD